eukprot:7818998-Alexandrium_andersonii.AAC.1
MSWADSGSALKTTQNAPLGSFRDRCLGRSWSRAVPGSNAWSDVAVYAGRIADWGGLEPWRALGGLQIALWAPCG